MSQQAPKSAFTVSIVQRFIKGKDFEKFVEQYTEARKIGRSLKQPSKLDFRIAQSIKNTKSLANTVKEFQVTPYKVYTALARVEAWAK
jgi:hypothetical protein